MRTKRPTRGPGKGLSRQALPTWHSSRAAVSPLCCGKKERILYCNFSALAPEVCFSATLRVASHANTQYVWYCRIATNLSETHPPSPTVSRCERISQQVLQFFIHWATFFIHWVPLRQPLARSSPETSYRGGCNWGTGRGAQPPSPQPWRRWVTLGLSGVVRGNHLGPCWTPF